MEKQQKFVDSRFILRQVMARLGVSNAELGRRLGISRQMVHKIVNGDTDPTLSRLFEIADALKIKVQELFRE